MREHSIREKALALRRAGYSYSYIASQTNLSKSTLSGWLAHVPYTPNKETISVIGKARAASGRKKAQIKLDSILLANREAIDEIVSVNKRDLFMFGLGLYLGEGSKTHDIVRITNSDPQVLHLAIIWFQSLGVPKENFVIRLHLYPDSNIEESLQFWSLATGLEKEQFKKPHVDLRTNKKANKLGKLPYGTAHLGVKAIGDQKLGSFLARKIQAWTTEVAKQCGCSTAVE